MWVALHFLSVLALMACKTTEIAFYEHKQSTLFYASLDYEINDLMHAKKNGVLFVIDVIEIKRSNYIV